MSAQFFSQPIATVTVEELARLLTETPTKVQFIDVREPRELELASLPGFQNLPLSQYAEWSGNILTCLEPEKPTVVMCHHGMRSAQMCQWLMSQGFTQVRNVAGGIDAYSVLVDPSVPRY
ncbi:rhodanese-like domain-containing protein [Leptothermofonsia sp. ETS-13]|uniref:rhodanese-like domain-containing protein n=1 Tax=Leptothermofonsia sp. ETS-13 TaxID=3035696 RepID=UPI003BA37175